MKKFRNLALVLPIILLISAFYGYVAAARAIRVGNEAAPLPDVEGKELPGDKERFNSYVWSVAELKKQYKKVVVLDARTRAEYDKGHLPGAVQAHWQDWSNVKVKQGEKGWAQILPNEELKKKFGALGIDGKKPVLIYNDTLAGWGEEGRQLWTFRVFGLKNTYVLNGGIKAWTQAGGKLTKKAPIIKKAVGPNPVPDLDLFANTEYLAAKLGSVNVLDTREDEEYAGTKVYGEKQKGRIPGVKHIWFKDFYNTDGKLLSPAQIRARVEAVGFKPADEVILYCTGGIRSGFTTIVLRIAGYEKSRNYNVSFSEWAGTAQKIDNEVYKELD